MAGYFGPALALGAIGNATEDLYKEKLAQQKAQPAMFGQILQNVQGMQGLPYQKQKFEAEQRMLPLQEEQARLGLEQTRGQMGDINAQRALRETQQQGLATTQARRSQMQQELLGANGDPIQTQAVLRKYADILPAAAVGDIMKPPPQHVWDDPRYWQMAEARAKAAGDNATANMARVRAYEGYLKAQTQGSKSKPEAAATNTGLKMAEAYLKGPGGVMDMSKLGDDPALQQQHYQNLVAHFTNMILKSQGLPPSMPEVPDPIVKKSDSWANPLLGFFAGLFGNESQPKNVGPTLAPPPGIEVPPSPGNADQEDPLGILK